MGQTEAVCPACGYDFQDAVPPPPSLAKKLAWSGVVGVIFAAAFHFWWPDFYRDITTRPYTSFRHQVPPEIPATAQWLRSQDPLPLAALRGKVVWLEFSFLRCGGCRNMTPQLVEWHNKYSPDGLVIIDVYNGPADRQFDVGIKTVDKHLQREKVPYAVMYDHDGSFCATYGVIGYPVGYLIGRNGRVVWEDAPHGNQSRVERKIRQALAVKMQ
jgi:hypothetical protein